MSSTVRNGCVVKTAKVVKMNSQKVKHLSLNLTTLGAVDTVHIIDGQVKPKRDVEREIARRSIRDSAKCCLAQFYSFLKFGLLFQLVRKTDS